LAIQGRRFVKFAEKRGDKFDQKNRNIKATGEIIFYIFFNQILIEISTIYTYGILTICGIFLPDFTIGKIVSLSK